MNILIIGSKGFIGSHCVRYFSRLHKVWQCDVVTDYTSNNYSVIDATNADFNTVFNEHQFDVCVNCSGAASVPDSIKNPQRDFILNTTNVFRQLDALRKFNPKCKYINLSSAAVYGNPKYLPIDEAHPLSPISPYGVHKRMAEDICKEFYDNYKLAICSLRIFSAYGPGLKKQLFWDLYKKSLESSSVNLYGTGKESRDFIHINDIVIAIDLVICKSTFQNEIINIACGEEIEIEHIVAKFYKILNDTINFKFGGVIRTGDPMNWVADITKLESMGFKKSISIDEGLKTYAQWLKENA